MDPVPADERGPFRPALPPALGDGAEGAAPSILQSPGRRGRGERWGLHVGLFLATLATTTLAGGGVEGLGALDYVFGLVGREAVYAAEGWPARLADGLRYALAFLLFLGVHEGGHYVAARRRGLRVSPPYFLPAPLLIGTLGAVIRIREPLRRTRQLFDVGAAGPLAGFVVAAGLVVVGVATLPPPRYVLGAGGEVHAALAEYVARAGAWPALDAGVVPVGTQAVVFGDTLLWQAVRWAFPLVPPGYELAHYPVLLAGWLGLFFTGLNLLPVGQLDGGHVVYALFGPRAHAAIARVATLALAVSGTLGAAAELPLMTEGAFGYAGWVTGWPVLGLILLALARRYFGGDWRPAVPVAAGLLALGVAAAVWAPALADRVGYTGWLVWVALILFLIRVDHPPVLVREELTPMRRALGYGCLALFVLCFSFKPIAVLQVVGG